MDKIDPYHEECQICGVKIPVVEYESNGGLCDDCLEDDLFDFYKDFEDDWYFD